MKKLPFYIIALLAINPLFAQHQNDTLQNHSNNLSVEAGKYTTGNDWGFYAGHNSKEQQQFGEKYIISDHVHVLGVVAHLTTSTGTVTNPNFEIDFKLWAADPTTGKPSGTAALDDGHLHLSDANLGAATVVMFHEETHVDDAFFVTMDLGDYAHEGLAGDTIGLYYAPDGSRTANDIATIPYRNVFQAHSHGAPNWRDFYTQFTTPTAIATHLALYPIVELDGHTSLTKISKNGLQVQAPFPNPSNSFINIPFTIENATDVKFQIMDIKGSVIKSIAHGLTQAGTHQQKISIADLASGSYIISILTNEGAIGVKFNKI